MMIDPEMIGGPLIWATGPGLDPSIQFAPKINPVLTPEEKELFNQLQEGGPCVICGSKGVHAVDACLCKFVDKERSGALFWKKDTYYYIRKSVVAPLCVKHYQEAKDADARMRIGCVVRLLISSLFSYLMLLLKQRGHCVIFDSNVLTVILWFIVGNVVSFILIFGVVFEVFGLGRGISFDSVWYNGPLRQLLMMGWLRCHGKVDEDKLEEARQKGYI